MTIKQRYQAIINWFEANMPTAQTELHYTSPYELLVAVILSAQCTDKRINMVTPALFKAMPTPQAMAQSSVEEIYEYIKSVSYPNNKARNLFGMANMLVDVFNGVVPDTMEELVKLPGVGRKTANVVLSNAFFVPAIAVDTHVARVSNRLGLADSNDTLRIELSLNEKIPREKWSLAHHLLIFHGRRVCSAKKPSCETCTLKELCEFYSKMEE